MAKVRRSMGERSRRWHHVTGSSEDLLAGIQALRESVEELRELSDSWPRRGRCPSPGFQPWEASDGGLPTQG
jgi:hypothetical protein